MRGSVIKHIKLRLPGLGTRILCDQGRTLQGALPYCSWQRLCSGLHQTSTRTPFSHLVSLPVQIILTYTYTLILLITSSGNFRTGLFDIFLKLSSSGRPVQTFSFFWAARVRHGLIWSTQAEPCSVSCQPDISKEGCTGNRPAQFIQLGLVGFGNVFVSGVLLGSSGMTLDKISVEKQLRSWTGKKIRSPLVPQWVLWSFGLLAIPLPLQPGPADPVHPRSSQQLQTNLVL